MKVDKNIAKKINRAIKQGIPLIEVFNSGERFDFFEKDGVSKVCIRQSTFPLMQVYDIMIPENKVHIFSLAKNFSLHEKDLFIHSGQIETVPFSFMQKAMEDKELKKYGLSISARQLFGSLNNVLKFNSCPQTLQAIENLKTLGRYESVNAMFEEFFSVEMNKATKTEVNFSQLFSKSLFFGEPALSPFIKVLAQKDLGFLKESDRSSFYCELLCSHLFQGRNLERLKDLANILKKKGMALKKPEPVLLKCILSSGPKNLKVAINAASQIEYFKGFEMVKKFVCDKDFDKQFLLSNSIINQTHLSFYNKLLNQFTFGELISWEKNIKVFNKYRGGREANLLSILSRDLNKINAIRAACGVPKVKTSNKDLPIQKKKKMLDCWEDIRVAFEQRAQKLNAETVQNFIQFLEKDLLLSGLSRHPKGQPILKI